MISKYYARQLRRQALRNHRGHKVRAPSPAAHRRSAVVDVG
jgi:hypothetical protein